jgi:hypothetical protein
MADQENPTDHTLQIKTRAPRVRYVVKIDGEYSCFASKGEMPDFLRAEVEEIERAGDAASTYSVFIAGQRSTYNRLEDMPEDIQQVVRAASLSK